MAALAPLFSRPAMGGPHEWPNPVPALTRGQEESDLVLTASVTTVADRDEEIDDRRPPVARLAWIRTRSGRASNGKDGANSSTMPVERRAIRSGEGPTKGNRPAAPRFSAPRKRTADQANAEVTDVPVSRPAHSSRREKTAFSFGRQWKSQPLRQAVVSNGSR